MATRGALPKKREIDAVSGCRLSAGLYVSLYEIPGLASSAIVANSASAHAALSRRRCIACDVLDHHCCSSLRFTSSTVLWPWRTVNDCRELALTTPNLRIRPAGGPHVEKPDLNSISSLLRIWNTAPSSSLNRAGSTSSSELDLLMPSSITSTPQRPANIISTSVSIKVVGNDVLALGVAQVRCLVADTAQRLGQGRAAQRLVAASQVNKHQDRLADILHTAQLRRPGLGNVADNRESRDDNRHGGGHCLEAAIAAGLGTAVLPRRLHRCRVLADGDLQAEARAQLLANGVDSFVQSSTLAGVVDGSHPVGRQLHARQAAAQIGCAEVHQTLNDRHAGRSSRRNQRQRGLLAHRHGLARAHLAVDREAASSDRNIGNRGLPGTDHLVAGDKATDGTITDGDQERLGADRGHQQHAAGRLAQQLGVAQVLAVRLADALHRVEHSQLGLARLHNALQTAVLGEQSRHGHVDWVEGTSIAVGDDEAGHAVGVLGNDSADIGVAAALAVADAHETVVALGVDQQHVALLGFVAPNLQRAHALVRALDLAQLELAAEAGVVDELGQRVGQTAGADVVDHGNGVLVAQGHARVDDHLRAALNLGVAALHTVKVELGRGLTTGIAGSSTATKADQHGRATQHNNMGAVLNIARVLERVLGAHSAQTTGNQDGLVEAAELAGLVVLAVVGKQRAEDTRQARPAKLVVVAGRANGRVQHNVQTAGVVGRLANVDIPGRGQLGDQQIRDPETAETSLGRGAATDSTLVTDLTTGTGSRTLEGRDGSGVVVGLDLGQEARLLSLLDEAPDACVIVGGPELRRLGVEHGGVVAVRGHSVAAVAFVGVADHLEQRLGLELAVNGPAGVELLVAAVLRVDLGKAEQLNIVGAAAERAELVDEVRHLVLVQGKALGTVVGAQHVDGLGAGLAEQIDGLEGAAVLVGKHAGQVGLVADGDGLGHAVVDEVAEGQSSSVDARVGQGLGELNGHSTAALDALDLGAKTTHSRNAGSLGAPGRDVAGGNGNGRGEAGSGGDGRIAGRARGLGQRQQLLEPVNDVVGRSALLQADVVRPVATDGRDLERTRGIDAVRELLRLRRRVAGLSRQGEEHGGHGRGCRGLEVGRRGLRGDKMSRN
ncbi:multidrug resistance transport transmembrane protein [Ophiostoma piceae UAMH 11346]|uniref:Multidrug resistance transport transmembrane protein n=1 Tax=Ophiostoma piceae (strain UAMH 11346) TaxID=1262450 RepID=S3CHF7_OPHP1|nr:multidrug resistance transport transmembrane protein [Ophiostoma piceae UAMH 11346]